MTQHLSLSPCPFCGRELAEVHSRDGGGFDETFHAECEQCGAEGPVMGSREMAAAAWNERFDPSPELI